MSRACKCITKFNRTKAAVEANTRIDAGFIWQRHANGRVGIGTRAEIVVAKQDIKRRVKPKRVFATYCPFCGKKYPEAKR